MSLVGIAAKRIVTCDPARATAENPLAAIEDAVLGGFDDDDGPNNVFVAVRREGRSSTVVAITTREAIVQDMLSNEPSSLRVYAVPTVRGVDDRRHPILDVARVFERGRPASAG